MSIHLSIVRQFTARLRRHRAAALVLVVGTVISGGLFFVIHDWEDRETRSAFHALARQRMELLRESLGNSLEALHALRALYQSGIKVDRTAFRHFVEGALDRRTELQALSWTPRVPPSDRARFESAARADGFSGFTFTERDPATGHLVASGERTDDYYPVYFIEPLEHNRAAFGFDLNSRAETIFRARDSGRAAATSLIRLIQEEKGEPGFIVYLPLYRGPTPSSVEARREALTGFVAAVFRVADLVRPALADQPGLHAGVHDQSPDASNVSYVAPPDTGPPVLRDGTLTESLAVADHIWSISFAPTADFLSHHAHGQSWVVFACGLLITALVTGYFVADQRRAVEIASANAALQSEVSERKRAEDAAAAANRAKTDFLTSLSHEIRTPLNSILGYTQILERDTALPYRHRDAIGAVANSGRHLLGLLNSILDLARIEAGRMELHRDVFDLSALVHGLAEMFKPRCAEKRINLRIDCIAGTDASTVLGDEGKLRQILINLIGNAVKFTPRGDVIVGVRPLEADGLWQFEVLDTGIGMSAEERVGLCSAFYQTAAGRRLGGAGLGLAIARGHVELMGGTLDVRSEKGSGTRFSFALPLPAAVVAAPAQNTPGLPHLATGIRVRALVVDDNRDNRRILARLLADIGCVVADAASGRDARDIARAAPPDILFLDLVLADTTGPELLADLRADGLPEQTPVLLHTAALLAREERDALRATGADLLQKPFRAEDLCTCLRQLPGVRFDEANIEPLAPVAFDLDQITLSPGLCERMSVAAELHSTTVLKACLEELRQQGGPSGLFADQLRHMLRAYDLAGIARLLEQLRVRSSSHSPA